MQGIFTKKDPLTGTCKTEAQKETEEDMLHGKMTSFGTPFSWTFPSKKRGKEFQVKGSYNLTPIDLQNTL